jgi:UDP-N-acetylmuramyl pentapeptide phosphotransferase/UDP-N-acetylglucosamine-1-phosphate transferase
MNISVHPHWMHHHHQPAALAGMENWHQELHRTIFWTFTITLCVLALALAFGLILGNLVPHDLTYPLYYYP